MAGDRHHFGVYGIWQQSGRIVLVRKTRGPYKGLLDLPGGSPERDESELATLSRELQEECGVELARTISSAHFEIRVDRDSTGQPIDFLHVGVISHVEVAGSARSINDEDVAGVVLATAEHAKQFSPLVLEALRCFPELRR
ncbi:NUDIX domain-containing protein [Microlunatus sp. GCM10028923]|uniref:NUDIX domain-containing protein n=1 Tax=Microlunatus sp. GCM10028923 TaxID=3273400 RepID=UPI00361DB11D